MKFNQLASSKEKRLWIKFIVFILRCSDSQKIKKKIERIQSQPSAETPFLPGLWWIEPLLRHQLNQAQASPKEVFGNSYQSLQLTPTSYEVLLRNDILRRKSLEELVLDLNAPVMLIKGMGVSQYYPQSALREMEDIDLVVLQKDWALLHESLREKDWKNTAGNCWVHSNGTALEVNFPKTQFAQALWRRAIVDPRFVQQNVMLPTPFDHLAILANHTAKSGGSRLWREFADALFLLENSSISKENLGETLNSLSQNQKPQFLGFLQLIRVLAPEIELPESETKCDERILKFYLKMLTEPLSESSLNILDNFLQNPFRRMAQEIKSTGLHSGSTTTNDSQLGKLAPAGSLMRKVQKLKIFIRLIFIQQGWRKRRLIIQRRKLHAFGKSFHPLETNHHD